MWNNSARNDIGLSDPLYENGHFPLNTGNSDAIDFSPGWEDEGVSGRLTPDQITSLSRAGVDKSDLDTSDSFFYVGRGFD